MRRRRLSTIQRRRRSLAFGLIVCAFVLAMFTIAALHS